MTRHRFAAATAVILSGAILVGAAAPVFAGQQARVVPRTLVRIAGADDAERAAAPGTAAETR